MSVYIKIQNVDLSYPILDAKSKSLKHNLLQLTKFTNKIKAQSGHVIIDVFKNFSIEFNEGDRIGLIGHNGAGKSTLLKLLAGIYKPNKGIVDIHGKLSSILDINFGINFDLTGYENIELRARIMGLDRKQIQDLEKDVVSFTELGDFLSLPVRTYSSGMAYRLAFAITTYFTSDILIQDEGISAGDKDFIHKANKRMNHVMNHAKIMVLSSHFEYLIRENTNKVLWLENGTIKMFGKTDDVLKEYYSS